MSDESKIIKSATFNRILVTYIFFIVIFWCFVSVIGIIFIPLWLFIGFFFSRRYYNSLECTLTEKTIEIKKGVLFHVEKTIPLDRIQDLTLRDGPFLRALKLCMVEIETAGQSNPQGSDAKIIGIDDAKGFRDSVLKQRDGLRDEITMSKNKKPVNVDSNEDIFVEIRDTLVLLVAPFAPHLGEELWEKTGHSDSIFNADWPKWDAEKLKSETVTVVVQVNGE